MQRRSFRKTWKTYIRGGIVSEHAKRIIVNFVSACCASARRDSDDEEDTKPDEAAPLPVPGMLLSLSSVQRLVGQSRFVHQKDRDDEATKRSIKVGNALALGTAL